MILFFQQISGNNINNNIHKRDLLKHVYRYRYTHAHTDAHTLTHTCAHAHTHTFNYNLGFVHTMDNHLVSNVICYGFHGFHIFVAHKYCLPLIAFCSSSDFCNCISSSLASFNFFCNLCNKLS